jgi:SAM-dependent methyltransferase
MTSTQKSITRRIAELLCDPLTEAPLRLDGNAYLGGTMPYPIIDGVPRFVKSDFYVRSFSFEWNTHDRTQLDIYRQDQPSEREFIAKTAFTPEFLSGKLVLDAGVGAGRYAELASRWGADVVGVDLSYAVEAAERNLGTRDNVWIAQADIAALPFRPNSFDVIFSIGVLHHTPNTRAYFNKLVPLLKPGGVIAIWVYPKNEAYIVRQRWVRFVNKLPVNAFYAWCRWFVPWAERHLDHPLVGALRRVFPFPTHGLGIEYDILDTFDGYSPSFHGVHSPEEVETWFREIGLVDVLRPSNWDTCVRGAKASAITG